MSSVRTRAGIAPNKPAVDNLGALRTHIYNYALAKSLGGTFVLRFDDTNKKIHKKEWVTSIEQQLAVVGVKPDYCSTRELNGVSEIQSERQEIYDRWVRVLFQTGFAYELPGSKAAKISVKKYRKVYGERVEWTDLILGDLAVDISRLQDYFILRSDGTALYHLACIIDDHEMGISHNLRGQDKISSLPYQMIIRDLLELNHVQYGHLPLLLGQDGRRLSTRKGDPSFRQLTADGFLKDAILSYVCSSGYGNPDTLYPSMEAFVSVFDLQRVHHNSSQINMGKLLSINKAFVKRMKDDEFLSEIRHYAPTLFRADSQPTLARLLLAQKNRIKTLKEACSFLEMIQRPDYEPIADRELREVVIGLVRELGDISLDVTQILGLRPDLDRGVFCRALRWILTGSQNGLGVDLLVPYFLDSGGLSARVSMATFAAGRQTD